MYGAPFVTVVVTASCLNHASAALYTSRQIPTDVNTDHLQWKSDVQLSFQRGRNRENVGVVYICREASAGETFTTVFSGREADAR